MTGFSKPRARGLAVLCAAVVMQLCLGATYSWSVFVHPLRDLTGLNQGPVQLPFTVFYFAFPATMVFSGGLLRRRGPRQCAVIGGAVFGAGWMLAAAGAAHFTFTVAGIGLVAGIGAGIAYIVPIATCIKWFPDHKGLVTGIAVAGFGGGAALVSQVAGRLMQYGSVTPFGAFGLLGTVFCLAVVSAGMFMIDPPGAMRIDHDRQPFRAMAGSRYFRLLYVAMFAGLAAGFTVNANLQALCTIGGVQTAVAAVSLFALANAAGRIAWGALFDRSSPRTAITANLALQAAVLAAAPLLCASAAGFLAFAGMAGLNYGGVLVLYVSAAANRWGPARVGQIYGWLFSANIPAACAPMAAGFVYDQTGTFLPFLLGAAIILVGGAVLFFTASPRSAASGPSSA